MTKLTINDLLNNAPANPQGLTPQQEFNQWSAAHGNETSKSAYRSYKAVFNKIPAFRPITYTVDQEKKRENQIKGIIMAAKDSTNLLVNKVVVIKITAEGDRGGPDHVYYRILNPNTIDSFLDYFEDAQNHVTDSSDSEIWQDIKRLKSIHMTFRDRNRGGGGVFPFINVFPNLDLSKYGIYSTQDDERCLKPCLYTAFENSGMYLPPDDLKLLLSTIQTRYVKREDLKILAEVMHINIKVKVLLPDQTVTKSEFKAPPPYTREIKLWLIYNHFFVNQIVPNISTCYIENFEAIEANPKLSSNPRKTLLKNYSEKRYTFHKPDFPGTKIGTLLKVLFQKKYFKPIDEIFLSNLEWSFRPYKDLSFDSYEPVIIRDRKDYKKDKPIDYSKYTEFFFGYVPEPEEIPERIEELQKVVNSLILRHPINVTHYYRFSELMQKIMYEYGCYDKVYKVCGHIAQAIRNQCRFLRPHTFNNRPLYLKQKLYYIDINGAFMAMAKRFPIGKDLINPTQFNYRIGKLLQTLYDIRRASNPKLNLTIKFLMNSCYGYAIRKPKMYKTRAIKTEVNLDDPYLLGFNENTVSTINSIVSSYTTPHFVKEILDEFHNFIDKIKTKVNVFYENIDAFLISEEDFHKLESLGYIGPELGKFKIENIFTEIAILSSRKYIAKLETGEYFFHCVKEDTDVESFISLVQSKST